MPFKKRTVIPGIRVRKLSTIKARKERERQEFLKLIARPTENIPVKRLASFLRRFPGDRIPPTTEALKETHEFRRVSKRHIVNHTTAIAAFCAQCQCATNATEAKQLVRDCELMFCPLWAFRLGMDPFYNRR